jgi:hypothetical protein
MPGIAAILEEVQKLYSVSDRLDSLAEQHPLVSEALITISGSVRNYRHSVGGVGCNENSADSRAGSSKCLSRASLLWDCDAEAMGHLAVNYELCSSLHTCVFVKIVDSFARVMVGSDVIGAQA